MVTVIKKLLFTILFFFFFIEILFQVSFFFNLKWFNLPILFYNPYCDQKYWNFTEPKTSFGPNIETHSILSYKKKELSIPEKFEEKHNIKNSNVNLVLYGSSYINHQEFKALLKEKKISNKNYSLDSYGLDQIYLSYKLTAHQNANGIIVIGFLLEDLDRILFNNRDYSKVKFERIDNTFMIKDLPNNKTKVKRSYDFYVYRFILNFKNLIFYNFDPRKSMCKSEFKKDLFRFFIEDIKKIANKYNQKIFIITFNLKEDLIKKPSWRYEFVKNELSTNSIKQIDSLEILKNSSRLEIDTITSYFGKDLHNNRKSFSHILEMLQKEL